MVGYATSRFWAASVWSWFLPVGGLHLPQPLRIPGMGGDDQEIGAWPQMLRISYTPRSSVSTVSRCRVVRMPLVSSS